MSNYENFHVFILGAGLFTLCLSILGCNNAGTKTCLQGEAVICNKKNGEYIDKYCTIGDNPPCECYDYVGAIWEDRLPLFASPCDPSIFGGTAGGPTTGGPTGGVEEPYYFECGFWSGQLCTEFDTYYCDRNRESYNSYQSNDWAYRPIYVRFEVSDFSIKNFDYILEIIDPRQQLVSEIKLSGDLLSTPAIRYLEPATCSDDACPTVGVVRMSIANMNEWEQTLKLVLYKVDHKDLSRTKVMVDQTSFTVKPVDKNENGDYSTDRLLKFVTFKKGALDLTSYSMADRSMNGDSENDLNVLHHAFGDWKSNMRFTTEPREISGPYIDNDDDIMLDNAYFSPLSDISENIKSSLHQWAIRVYDNVEYSNPEYRGFAVEARLVKSYNFKTFPPSVSQTFEPSDFDYFGTTLNDVSSGRYFKSVIVLRAEVIALLDNYLNLETNEVSMMVFMHEMGHMWSKSATTGNDCIGHTEKCKGRDISTCLFHGPCSLNESWITQAIKDPKYCEGHQQYFMNQLIIK